MKHNYPVAPQFTAYPLPDDASANEWEHPSAIVLLMADPSRKLTDKVKALADNPAAWDHSWFHHYE